MPSKILQFFLALICISTSARADTDEDFARWLSDFRAQALSRGISQATISDALDSVYFDDGIIELDRKQPESTLTFAQYRKKVLSQRRINDGRERFYENATLLKDTGKRYGVDPEVIVALWGVETMYGEITGGYYVIEALATLAFEGRRADFFRKELLNALQILDEGHIKTSEMLGSWAGAMGQCQFMPSSFLRFAADGNGDNHKDIWNTLPDIFASIANYLSEEGWVAGQPIAVAITMEKKLPASAYSMERTMSLAEWRNKGVSPAHGTYDGQLQASLIRIGDDAGAPSYLVFNNYKVLLKWNRSRYFATTVSLLADNIVQGN